MMDCEYCAQGIAENFTTYNDCVLQSLEKIKNHYLFVKNVVNKHDQQLAQLQLRNQKLLRAVDLLQKERKRVALASPRKRKRRKANVPPSLTIDLSCMEDYQDEERALEEAVAMDKTTDDLNMALNSEQIFDCSSADCSTAMQWTPPHNEIIGETEVVASPRVLQTSFELRRKLREQNNKCNNDENRKPISDNIGAVVKTKTDSWIGKEKKPQLQSDLKKSTRVDRNESFIKPLAIPKMEKKLSLKKPVKLKQTRLQLDVAREKSSSGSDTTFCEDIIGDSPNPYKTHEQTKPARSWLLRTSNSSANLSRKDDAQNNLTDTSDCIKFNSDDDEYFENVFKFAQNITSTNNETSSKKPLSTSEFQLSASSPEKAATSASKCDEKIESSLESVIILTPATQDIIFVDDSCVNTHIESMDLLEDLLKEGDESFEHLKRIENDKIKKLQKMASTVSVQNPVASKPPMSAYKLSLNKSPISAITTVKDANPTIAPAVTKIKQEITTQPTITPPKESEESEDLMPQPFIVKVESGKDENNVMKQKQKLSIKDKFNIDCRDCQQYIDFLGASLSEKEIMAHLERCTRHKARDVLGNQTPEGFWDPFIPTFEANDPRNETLIDNRFCDKNK